MADIRFDCPACAQPMIADESGCGEAIPCPQCTKSVQIPLRGIPVSERPELVGEIVSLKNQREKLTAALAHAKTQLNHVNIQARQATDRLGNWEKQRDALHAALSLAKQELDTARGQIEEAKAGRERTSGAAGVVAELNKQKARTHETEEQLKAASAESRTRAAGLQQTQAELTQICEQLSKARKEREELSNELAQTKASLAEMQSACGKMKEEIEKAQAGSLNLKNSLNKGETEREKLAGELLQKTTALAEMQQRAVSAEGKCGAYETELKHTGVELSNAGQRIVAIETEREQIERRLNATQLQLDETKKRVETIEAERRTTQAEREQALTKLEETKKCLGMSEQANERSLKELKEAREEIAHGASELAALQKKHDKLFAKLNRTKNELTKIFNLQADGSKAAAKADGNAVPEPDIAADPGEPNLQHQNDFLSRIIAHMNEERSLHASELKFANSRFNLLARGVMLFVVFVLIVAFYLAWLGTKNLTML